MASSFHEFMNAPKPLADCRREAKSRDINVLTWSTTGSICKGYKVPDLMADDWLVTGSSVGLNIYVKGEFPTVLNNPLDHTGFHRKYDQNTVYLIFFKSGFGLLPWQQSNHDNQFH